MINDAISRYTQTDVFLYMKFSLSEKFLCYTESYVSIINVEKVNALSTLITFLNCRFNV